MPSKAPSSFNEKLRGKRRYGADTISEMKLLMSKGNGYEGRYDFPVTVTKIEDKDNNV
jgi:hypothetical protein